MRPRPAQRSFVEVAHDVLDLFELEQPRALGYEQPYPVLHRRDVRDEIEVPNRRQANVTLE